MEVSQGEVHRRALAAKTNHKARRREGSVHGSPEGPGATRWSLDVVADGSVGSAPMASATLGRSARSAVAYLEGYARAEGDLGAGSWIGTGRVVGVVDLGSASFQPRVTQLLECVTDRCANADGWDANGVVLCCDPWVGGHAPEVDA